MVFIKSNLIDSDGDIYLKVDFLIEMNNIITGPNSITLRKINAEPYGFDKIYIDKDRV